MHGTCVKIIQRDVFYKVLSLSVIIIIIIILFWKLLIYLRHSLQLKLWVYSSVRFSSGNGVLPLFVSYLFLQLSPQTCTNSALVPSSSSVAHITGQQPPPGPSSAIFSNVTPRPCNNDPEYCLLSKELS